MKKQLRSILFHLILFFSFVPVAFAADLGFNTLERVPIPVKISAKNADWHTTISICNTTVKAIPLTNIELNFKYKAKIQGTIWGSPWAAWRVRRQGDGSVRLLGGTPTTPALQPDPSCTKPMTVIFTANPRAALPTGFVFKAEGAAPPVGQGKLNITMQAAPAAGVGNPQVTVTGPGFNQQQTLPWGQQWEVANLTPGSYKITSSNVSNGTQSFQADPIDATVNDQATTQVAVVYKAVPTQVGNLTINMPAAPGAGVSNPQVTVTGMGTTKQQVVNWGTKWEITNLQPGAYKVSSSKVDNGTDFFEAQDINTTVNNQSTTQVMVQYTRVSPPTQQGNLNVKLPAAPAAGVSNPQVTVTGMGTTKQQVVNWGTEWLITNLPAGAYTVTGSNVSNATDTYQSSPVNATVNANATTQAALTYTRVQPGRPASWNNIKHIVVIVLENTNAADALRQPFMNSLTQKGAYSSQFFAITHPSQPNYIAMVAGSLLGVDSDDDFNLNDRHVGDLIDAKGLSWKAYAEDLPSTPCFKGDSGKYDRKHEPFISFTSVQNNPAQCSKIVNATQFFNDVAADRLPTFSFYVPNEDNNGHDTGVQFADSWLSRVFGPVFNDPKVMGNTLFIVTFDEDDSGDNKVYTAFVGAAVKPAVSTTKRYTFYNMLRTIEEILQLGTLGKEDQAAAVINDIWQP